MFTPEQYRAKAMEYGESLKTSTDPHVRRLYQELRRHFGEPANKEQQWNTLPAKLRRELFDNAGAMGELSDVAALRGQIARFLHTTTETKTPAAS